jgi:uncharacterized tellurite resistance protein B-like protein
MAEEASYLQQQGAVDAEVVPKLVAMQAEYAEKIREASGRGDAKAIQELLGELTAISQTIAGFGAPPQLVLVKEPETLQETPKKRLVYDESLCAIDLDAAVYDGDRDMYLALIDDPRFSAVQLELTAHAKGKDLPKTALRLTPGLAPKVYEDVLGRCRKNLGLKAELEIHVIPSTRLRSFGSPLENGKIVLGVTSAMLERFEADELAFVLGREIGHAILLHHRLPLRVLQRRGRGRLTPLHALRLPAWKRSADLSADRVGLVASRSFEAAMRALFKLSSGVTSKTQDFQLREYVDQLAAEVGEEVLPEDWFRRHAFSPTRLRALDLFARSETYFKLTAQDAGNAELSEEQLEFEVKTIMSQVEPSYLQESTELGRLMKNFVFLGSFLVAAAADRPDVAQLTALASLLAPEEVEARVAAMLEARVEEVQAQIAQMTANLNEELPAVARLCLVNDLTEIAASGGAVSIAKLKTLHTITASLHLRQEFVDYVLAQTAEEE